MSKVFKIIFLAVISFIIDIVIAIALIALWRFVFHSNIIGSALEFITILVASWYAVDEVFWAVNRIRQLYK